MKILLSIFAVGVTSLVSLMGNLSEDSALLNTKAPEDTIITAWHMHDSNGVYPDRWIQYKVCVKQLQASQPQWVFVGLEQVDDATIDLWQCVQ